MKTRIEPFLKVRGCWATAKRASSQRCIGSGLTRKWSYSFNLSLSAEGVRQTLILNLLNRQRHADSVSRTPATAQHRQRVETDGEGEGMLRLVQDESSGEVSAQNERFLASKLDFVRDGEGKMRCVDQDGGLVMAAWETDVMQVTSALLCEKHRRLDQAGELSDGQGKTDTGLRVLNIGFGLGIVDECLQLYKPSRHVIVEAHPDAVAYAHKTGWADRPGVEILAKRWEDALDELGGEQFDVIYWDTYAQGYAGVFSRTSMRCNAAGTGGRSGGLTRSSFPSSPRDRAPRLL